MGSIGQLNIALEPGNLEIVRQASTSAAILGRFDEALQLARRAVDLDQLNANAWENLGGVGFFHNGAYVRLGRRDPASLERIRVGASYDPVKAGVPIDLAQKVGPIKPVLDRLDPLLRVPTQLTPAEFSDLLTFVRDGLLDERAKPENLCKLVPAQVPSSMPVLQFQACN